MEGKGSRCLTPFEQLFTILSRRMAWPVRELEDGGRMAISEEAVNLIWLLTLTASPARRCWPTLIFWLVPTDIADAESLRMTLNLGCWKWYGF